MVTVEFVKKTFAPLEEGDPPSFFAHVADNSHLLDRHGLRRSFCRPLQLKSRYYYENLEAHHGLYGNADPKKGYERVDMR